ncbi:MAG: helix-turn-helix domain-containing protein [Anaerolineae bacterium]|nr:helix-turn-helix domain-containing protein [Anaerolineae bacterium]
MTKKEHINLSEADLEKVKQMLKKGNLPVRKYRRALALQELNQGQSYTQVSKTIGVTVQSLSIWAEKYKESGLAFLTDKPRSGRPKKMLSIDEAKITALACSDAPEGYGQWSLRLLAEHGVELVEAETLSYSSVRRILKKTNSSPT